MNNVLTGRLHNQQISQSRYKKPDELLSYLVAIQGQDYLGAKWSAGLRLPGSTDVDIEKALLDKTIVRTWAMRGTLHLLAASDIRWVLALLSPRIIANNARRYKELGLDEDTLVRSNEILAKALQNGKELTRTALLEILKQNNISTEGQRAPYMLQRASLSGLICQSVMRGKDPLYFSMDSLPEGKMPKGDEALAKLTKLYFISRGPATLQDFIWWSGLSAADAKKGLEMAKSQLVHEAIEGQVYWFSPLSFLPEPAPYYDTGSLNLSDSWMLKQVQHDNDNVCLLPGFDEYLLSYKDRSMIMDKAYMKSLTPTNGMLPPTIVINGIVAGTWKRTINKNKVMITLNPSRELTETESKAITACAKRYGEFLGVPITL